MVFTLHIYVADGSCKSWGKDAVAVRSTTPRELWQRNECLCTNRALLWRCQQCALSTTCRENVWTTTFTLKFHCGAIFSLLFNDYYFYSIFRAFTSIAFLQHLLLLHFCLCYRILILCLLVCFLKIICLCCPYLVVKLNIVEWVKFK